MLTFHYLNEVFYARSKTTFVHGRTLCFHCLFDVICVFPFGLCRIIFVFHKNGHLSYKAKVKPPRLNGQRVGVYSTRSPHRPNALGLTLAKLDKIEGRCH